MHPSQAFDSYRARFAELARRQARLLSVFGTPGGLRAMSTWRPFSISAFRLTRALSCNDLTFQTVIDVGANVGQFSAAALGTWPAINLIAFEPLAEAAARLRLSLGHLPNVEVHEVAVGSADGTTTFYPHAYSLSSSVLPSLVEVRGRHWAKELTPTDVPIGRLDTILAGRIFRRPCLLKLDVQGSELDVLAGAAETISQVDAVVLEVAFEPSYVNQPLFPEAHRALAGIGWTRVRPLDWRQDSGRVVEADMLYTHG